MRITDNFWKRINKTDSCWLWNGVIRDDGYACYTFWENGKRLTKMVHRIAYELLVAPIAEGLELDHLCRVRSCVNPAHLEPVTPKVNVSRSLVGFYQTSKTHCPQGHPYDEANTRVSKSGRRNCRTCHRDRMRLRRHSLLGVS